MAMTIKIHAGDWGKCVAGFGPGWNFRYRIALARGFLKGHDTYFFDTDVAALDAASEESVNRLGGAAGWGAAGGFLLGPAGLLAGLVLGGRGKDVTFVCEFRDGRKILATADDQTFTKIKVAVLKGEMEAERAADLGPGESSQGAAGDKSALNQLLARLKEEHVSGRAQALPDATRSPEAPVRKPSRRSGETVTFFQVLVGVAIAVALWWFVLLPLCRKVNSRHPQEDEARETQTTPVRLNRASASTTKSTSRLLLPGDDATITRSCYAGASEGDYHRILDLAVSRDKEGLALMVIAGKSFLLDGATKCRVINPGVTTEVRILDGLHRPQSVFLARELVSRK